MLLKQRPEEQRHWRAVKRGREFHFAGVFCSEDTVSKAKHGFDGGYKDANQNVRIYSRA